MSGRVLRFDRGVRGDEEARSRICESLDESLLVEAAAGTGKTTVLVHRLVATLATGRARVDGIVAVTFTRKAAGELKLRLRQELDRARTAATAPEPRRNLEAAIARLEEAWVGTIHSFCADILRERPVEAGVDPGFQEVADGEAPEIFARAFDRFIQERLDVLSPGLRRALSRLALDSNPNLGGPIERLRDAGWALADFRDFAAPWRAAPFDRDGAVDLVVDEVMRAAALAQRGRANDVLVRSLEPVILLASWIERAETVAERDYDALEARLLEAKRRLGRERGKGHGPFAEGLSRQKMIEEREGLLTTLEHFGRGADAELAVLLRDELMEVVGRYEELKRQAGRLDFTDLLIRARGLLRDHADVRRHLQARFTHLFIDEFQDTDPLQAEILLLLAADDPGVSDWRKVRPGPGKLFLVGDPKQSIYRFRRADVRLYQQVKDQLERAGVEIVHLTRSFRAVPSIQRLVNAAFAPEMDGDRDTGSPDYVPLRPSRAERGDQPTLIVLPAPRPYSPWRITQYKIEECLPEATGAFVAWLLESSWSVEDPERGGELTHIAPRHICILFRRFVSWGSDVTRGYTAALEARGIPHLLIGSRTFHQREEIETVRAALIAVEWPDDELAVWATLRGSLFAFTDDDLLRFRHRLGRLHPFRRKLPEADAGDGGLAAIGEALAFLAELHRRRNARAVVETVQALLAHTRAHAAFALRPAGHQVLANVERVCDLARGYELAGGRSFRGFVERLNAEAEKPTSTESPVVEEGAEGVRIMTVHNAKGLEYPVVILADMTAGLTTRTPQRTLDPERELCAQQLLGCTPIELLERTEIESARDRAEAIRIAYVAATRARDLLVIPGIGDQPFEGGWLDPLNKAIFPASPERRRSSREASGCPPFGETTVLERPMEFDGRPELSVRPGVHDFPQSGEPAAAEGGGSDERYEVVWWDPATLPPFPGLAFGLRQEEILVEDEDKSVGEQSLARYRAWAQRQEDIRARGGQPRFDVQAVTEIEVPPPDQKRYDIALEILDRPAGRPSGVRFGTLVHTVLRDVPFDAAREAVAELTALQGRLLDCPDAEVIAGADAVWSALQHPLLREAAALDEDRRFREAPFALHLEGDFIVEGTLDLALRRPDGWLVIDFKTDADLAERREAYERQLAWYLYALEKLTGEQGRGVLLAV